MACAEALEQEQRFLDALLRTTRFTIHGDELGLHSRDEQRTLPFEAAALR
jgi:heat shock protein HslJ